MVVQDLVEAMERIAPLAYAESWDRVGLLVGRHERELDGPVLLTIDLTEAVLAEAVDLRASAVIAYHPPIWEPIEQLTGATARGRILLGAAESGIAVYTPHTALDATPGGVTDWLCEGLSGSGEAGRIAGDCKALVPLETGSKQVKIVTFVPSEKLEEVRNALATAGAGIIGGYRVCSFASPGTGTFLGGGATNPAAGQAGRFEQVAEHRLEMVCPRSALALAIETLRRFHPYEEVPFDVYELVAEPMRSVGVGRRLTLDQPATIAELGERLKKHLGRARVRAAIVGEDGPVSSLGVVPGAGESVLGAVQREGCEVFVTGEMRHHHVLAALHAGISVLLAGHTNTERGYLARLAERLGSELAGVTIVKSRADRDLLVVM